MTDAPTLEPPIDDRTKAPVKDRKKPLSEQILEFVAQVPIAEAFDTTLKLYRSEKTERGRLALMTARLALLKLVLQQDGVAFGEAKVEEKEVAMPQPEVFEIDLAVPEAEPAPAPEAFEYEPEFEPAVEPEVEPEVELAPEPLIEAAPKPAPRAAAPVVDADEIERLMNSGMAQLAAFSAFDDEE